MLLFIWNKLFWKLLQRKLLNEFGNFMQMQITGNGRSNRMLHINHTREPHITLDFFTFHRVSNRKYYQNSHLIIPASEWQHCLQSNLSQIHSYHGVKRPKKEDKKVCFSKEYLGFLSGALVSKLLLGCWGHFLYIFCHYNQTGHSVMCTIHMQLQRTAWNVAFYIKAVKCVQ